MVNLEKGARINLSKSDGGALDYIKMGLGWDPAHGSNIDLDASCVLLDDNKQQLDAIWFRQLTSRCGSVKHSGDNLTGEGDGDDEVIHLKLDKLPMNVQHVVFAINSFHGQTFEKVANAHCRIYDSKGAVLASYNLSEKGPHNAMIMVSLYRHNGAWKVRALGQPASGRLVSDLLPAIQSIL